MSAKENEKLNKDLQTALDICNNRLKEIERLNNIINELEYYLEYRLNLSISGLRDDEIRKTMNKLEELKEGK